MSDDVLTQHEVVDCPACTFNEMRISMDLSYLTTVFSCYHCHLYVRTFAENEQRTRDVLGLTSPVIKDQPATSDPDRLQ